MYNCRSIPILTFPLHKKINGSAHEDVLFDLLSKDLFDISKTKDRRVTPVKHLHNEERTVSCSSFTFSSGRH